jgi:nicotinic acetylcholine receptor, invertebrate
MGYIISCTMLHVQLHASVDELVYINGITHISYDGSASIADLMIIRSRCKIEMSQFPFDQQTCKLIFSSRMYDAQQMNLALHNNTAAVDTEYYNENSEWDLVETSVTRDLEIPNWHDMTFYVVLRRRPGFYVYVLIVPSLLLSLLTPLLFAIPPSRPDRTTLG